MSSANTLTTMSFNPIERDRKLVCMFVWKIEASLIFVSPLCFSLLKVELIGYHFALQSDIAKKGGQAREGVRAWVRLGLVSFAFTLAASLTTCSRVDRYSR